MEDATLAAAAARGDQEALTCLVLRYRRYVYAIAWKITLSQEDALDAVQEVYERLARRIGDYEGRGPFRAWLATLTARVALDMRRRDAARRETSVDSEALAALPDERPATAAADPRRRLEREQRLGLVEAAMAELSAQQRAIFALRFMEEMGPKEIAERLGIPAPQARSQLNRALIKIREAVARREK